VCSPIRTSTDTPPGQGWAASALCEAAAAATASRAGEHGVQPIALRAQFDAAMGLNSTAQERPVGAQHLGPCIAQRARQRGRSLDIAEHERDRSDRKIAR
jgi:hypothetical protein